VERETRFELREGLGVKAVEVVNLGGVGWSGRRDSNSRLSAWEADVLPLNYSRLNRLYYAPPFNYLSRLLKHPI
jgi:hypothetical protein